MMVQTLVVAALVIASAVFATWRLAPLRTKLRLLDALKPSTSNPAGRWLLTLRKGVATQLAHGCSACSSSTTHVKKHAAPSGR